LIDGHCHLDLKFGCCQTAIKRLYDDAKTVGIKTVVLLNIEGLQFAGKQGFKNLDVIKNSKEYEPFFYVFPSLHPFEPDVIDKLEFYHEIGIAGLKLHPRMHNYHIENKACVNLVKKAGHMELPVMICCFPDGINIKLGNTAASIGRLADQAQDTKIAIGHAGGHKIIDYLMVAKSCKNLYLDLSFSLLYYRGSSIINDIKYVINNINGERIIWGTDYPDRPYSKSVKESLIVFEELEINSFLKNKIFNKNCIDYLGIFKR